MRWLALLCCVASLRTARAGSAPSWGVAVPGRWRGQQAVGGSWGAFRSRPPAGDGAGLRWAPPVTNREEVPSRRPANHGAARRRMDDAAVPPKATADPPRGSAGPRRPVTSGDRTDSSVYSTSRTAPFYASLQPGPGPPLSAGAPLPETLNLTFTAGGLQHRLALRRAPSVLDPAFLVLRRAANSSSVSALDDGSAAGSCLYRGEVSRAGLAERGWAALDLCRHLTGAMRLGGEDLVLEAAPDASRRARAADASVIGPQTLRRVVSPHCGVEAPSAAVLSPLTVSAAAASRGRRWRRRAGRRQRLTVELAVFVDLALQRAMSDLYGEHTNDEITRYVITMVNAMELLYDDPSLGRSVRFVLKRLELLETAPQELEQKRDINTFLTSFCQWQQRENPESDTDPLHWDHAVLLTGEDLFTVDKTGRELNRQVVGFAPVGGMCTAASSCTVNEGKDFESVYIVAHEIGHSLGMHHDGQGNDCAEQGYIMSPTLGAGKSTWSSCSRTYLDRFAASRQARCLLDAAGRLTERSHSANSLPGERVGADEQCRLKYGPDSHRARRQPLDEVCANLHCKHDHHRWTSHPALEGTACGYDSWCRRGRCAPRLPSDGDVAGGWSSWGEFSPCASSCLTAGSAGLRKRARRCDSPFPRGSGATCPGGARQFELCPDAELCRRISHKTVDEYAHDICGKAVRQDSTLTGRGTSRTASSARQACAVWCERRGGGLQRHRQAFPDGVRCHVRGADRDQRHFCVDGTCQRFDCEPGSLFLTGAVGCGRQQLRQLTSREQSEPAAPVPPLARPADGQWSSWRSYSRCRFQCTAPAQGLELVQRKCERAPCGGLSRSVRHCAPRLDGTDCRSLHTPFEFASSVCRRYKDQLSLAQLSGVGLQLSASADDPDRPCTVTCQDRDAALRFYRVKGRDGWFPSGLDCSRGEAGRTAYCLSGKCVDFGPDGTPLHDARYDYAFLFESSFRYHRVTRDAAPDEESGTPPSEAPSEESGPQEAPLSRPGGARIRGSVDRAFIQRVIGDLQREQRPASNISAADIDLGNPLLLASLPPEVRRGAEAQNELSHAFAILEPALQVADEEGDGTGAADGAGGHGGQRGQTGQGAVIGAAGPVVSSGDEEQASRTAAELAPGRSVASLSRPAISWTVWGGAVLALSALCRL